MKTLLLDIETAPSIVYAWGLFKQNIAINQIDQPGYVLCWSAKWLGEDKILFDSIKRSGPEKMLRRIHKLVSEADAVCHYNGQKFDMPTLNKEFVIYGLPPPAPYKQIDLYQACKKNFRFVSNKLDFISQTLGLGEKVRHSGHELWTGCMNGDPASWKIMEEYNKQDVVLLEDLYNRLLPWLDKHPSHGALAGISCCPKCGSEEYQQRGYAVTTAFKYRRYQCKGCGGWFRGNKSVHRPHTERMANIA